MMIRVVIILGLTAVAVYVTLSAALSVVLPIVEVLQQR